MHFAHLAPRAQSNILRALNYARTHSGEVPLAAAPDASAPLSFVLAGLVPSDDDVRDYSYVPSGRWPLYEMDFRPRCSPIRDQGRVGSCTAFHVDSHCGFAAKRAGNLPLAYSTRANYAMSRQLMGLKGDSGASLRAAIHAAYKYGIPTEAQYPYGTDWAAIINTTVLPQAVMVEAAQNKIDAYWRLDGSLADPSAVGRLIDRALADGYTVGWGGFVHNWFFHLKGPLSTHAAVRHDPSIPNGGAIAGGHAMVIVGRSDSLGGYIMRNQYSETWGDGGYGLLLFSDVLGEGFEFWAVSGFDGSDVKPAPYDVHCAEAQAARLYRAAFGRYPDAGGLAYQTAEVARSGLLAVARAFMVSPEYQRLYGTAHTDEAFVSVLYAHALRATPDAAGYAHQLAALRAGMPRAQLLVNFSESPNSIALL
jgi:hypothetical protein